MSKKKEIKLNLKNTQIADAIKLDAIKKKLEMKKADEAAVKKKPAAPKKSEATKQVAEESVENQEEEILEQPRRARSKSVFDKNVINQNQTSNTVQTKKPPHIEKEEKIAAIAQEEEEKPVKLGPTGKHFDDLYPKKKEKKPEEMKPTVAKDIERSISEPKPKKPLAKPKFKEYRDVKPGRKPSKDRSFDARDRRGLRAGEEGAWKKKRKSKRDDYIDEELTIRPKELKVHTPISIKELARQMKLKAAELIQKLFMQGIVVTINDVLDDETTIHMLGHEFGCEISIDTSEEDKRQITGQSVDEEILSAPKENQKLRAPVVAFMGHVDHGKTSLIDYIRKSNIADHEAGAITQHIGAFRCHTDLGDLSVLDTPGHEAFSAMRARGADVTDIVILVVAGDEGIKAQTQEAIQHAKAAGVNIIVAINKSDKPGFNPDNVYRQLADNNLLPESWGGQIITVNCSAVTGEGVKELLEMIALQAEVLELRADPDMRARGTVLESELHKGFGPVATVIVQNGTLKVGDALVFGEHYARVKTMRDEYGKNVEDAIPSSPVEITGLSGVPEAGEEFIVVESEKEAKNIADARLKESRQLQLQQKRKGSLESLFQQAAEDEKKYLKLLIRADVQGSLEALKASLLKIESDKVSVEVIFTGVGEITESDIQLAAASNALIIGFHTKVESHANNLLNQYGVQIHLFDIIYHAVDGVRNIMGTLLDQVAKNVEKGKAKVKAVFKSSQYGNIAGCQVLEGAIHRNNQLRLFRGDNQVWTGPISSLKRDREDVREVQKGMECGIVLSGYNDVQEGDILEAFEVTYISQEL
ncbi:MAG: translation initiation factor IF-2 [Waddliaceae bacterium]